MTHSGKRSCGKGYNTGEIGKKQGKIRTDFPGTAVLQSCKPVIMLSCTLVHPEMEWRISALLNTGASYN
jgi:hypothetical protein